MKKASKKKQHQHDQNLNVLHQRIKEIEDDLGAKGKSLSEIWNNRRWKKAQHAYLQARGTCPECGSTDTEVQNHSLMWHDGDVVCCKCNTYVRSFDAG